MLKRAGSQHIELRRGYKPENDRVNQITVQQMFLVFFKSSFIMVKSQNAGHLRSNGRQMAAHMVMFSWVEYADNLLCYCGTQSNPFPGVLGYRTPH